jgi:type I restriction enzyme R subunit
VDAAEKKTLSETDICRLFITPAIEQAGWNPELQIRQEVTFTKGRIIVQGRTHERGESRRADYILYIKPNFPLAVVEAKDNNHNVGSGMQQALEYADVLDVPFVFSSNGDTFHFHDKTVSAGTVEHELALAAFPSPAMLWQQYANWKNLSDQQQQIVTQDYYSDGTDREPRYYQRIAINRTIEAIAKGQNRVLLVMATGTGKTYTAFQIIWRLWKSGVKKRILYLTDRNILADQTINNDFKPFGAAMHKVRSRRVDKAYEIYLALYQAVSGTEDIHNIYKQFSPEFFDLIFVDECHRGSAAENSAWREILEYFASATQIGLTATPKETEDVSNIDYFGKPVYTYSLKQGILDGFLAPYKVIRIDFDLDGGWRPEKGKLDKHGQVIEDRIYNLKDMDRTLVLDQRTQLVAKKITEYLKATDRFAKTIVFCDDIEHAERMRQALVNENADLVAENHRYVMKITGDDDEGKAQLDNFIMPREKYPVIATTSKLLTTGVDAQTVKLIVLDQHIKSMTEFKQIIGRGTRINEDFGKFSFTIMDFKKATELFADKKFDGEPVQVYKPGPDDPVTPPEGGGEGGATTEGGDVGGAETGGGGTGGGGGGGEPRRKYHVDDVAVKVTGERVQYYGGDGKLITESLKAYTRKKVLVDYASLDHFLTRWKDSDRKEAILQELKARGVLLVEMAEQVGKDLDTFDLICHVAFDQPPLTRKERAGNVRKRNYFTKYGDKARAVLEALLDKYADEGIETIETLNVLKVQPLSELGTPLEILEAFGGKDQYLQALKELEAILYFAA